MAGSICSRSASSGTAEETGEDINDIGGGDWEL